MANEKKMIRMNELTDDQLEKAAGGFAYQGDPLPPVESYSLKQCPNGHTYLMWTEKCPECGSDKYTIVSMPTS